MHQQQLGPLASRRYEQDALADASGVAGKESERLAQSFCSLAGPSRQQAEGRAQQGIPGPAQHAGNSGHRNSLLGLLRNRAQQGIPGPAGGKHKSRKIALCHASSSCLLLLIQRLA
jgi:hypothetical protein